jgi:hypothetical protein
MIATKGMSNKYVFLCHSVSPSLLFSNAAQFQAGTMFDVVFKWFRWIIAKISHNSSIV